MELLGQVAAVSAVTFVWAQFAQDTILIATASQGKDQLMQPGPFVNGVLLPNQTTQNRLFALYTGCLVVCGLLNSLSQRALSWLTVLCAWCESSPTTGGWAPRAQLCVTHHDAKHPLTQDRASPLLQVLPLRHHYVHHHRAGLGAHPPVGEVGVHSLVARRRVFLPRITLHASLLRHPGAPPAGSCTAALRTDDVLY